MHSLRKRNNTAWPTQAHADKPSTVETYKAHCRNQRALDLARVTPDARQFVTLSQHDKYSIALVKRRAQQLIQRGHTIDAELLRRINQL